MTVPFLVRNIALQPAHAQVLAEAAVNEGRRERASVNRLAIREVVDFFTQLQLAGLTFGVQAGTEDAGVAATNTIDDQLAFILADCNATYGVIPLLYEARPTPAADTTTLAMAMLELDMAKKRYSSAGTVFTARNLLAQAPQAFQGACYAGGDIVTLAKSAVPDSVELARKDYFEDALDDKIGYPGWWDPCVYSVKTRPMAVSYGVSAILGHLGSATALITGYARLEFAQLTIGQLSAA